MPNNFTWIPVFKAVASWILAYENRQPELVKILKSAGIDAGLEDRDKSGNSTLLQEIDPFTFLCMFTKYGVEKRKQLFAKLIEIAGLNVPVPSDFDGVPTANAMKVWMFPFKSSREDWMISTLWKLFKQSKAELDAEAFERALQIPGTGFAKLTEALFYVDPDRYFPIDGQTRPWLEEMGVPVPKGTLAAYLNALAEVRKRSSKSFAQLSLDAWEKNQGTSFGTQVVRDYLDSRFPDGRSGTKYIAAYKSSQGRQLALSANLKSEVKLYVDDKPPQIPASRIEEYPPERTRNGNLDAHAPQLGEGHHAYYVELVSIEELVQICDWYESKPDHQSITSPNPRPVMTIQPPLNQILYGPPGTGKTFATIDRALAILDPTFNGTRKERKAEFDRYAAAEQIKFVTFHQSFSYEDFVEGIRADTNETTNQLEYEVQDGIFKILCNAARTRIVQSSAKNIDLSGRRVWKLSLGQAGIEEGVYQDCIEKGLALIGFGGNADYSDVRSREDIARTFQKAVAEKGDSNFPVAALNTFIRQVKVGDLLVVTQGNLRFRAIGEVTSEYLPVSREGDDYSQGRKVNWLRVYDPGLPYGELMEKRFSQRTIYELNSGSINFEKLSKILAPKADVGTPPKRVLIIDEINRGNISRIFGELITLIEDSKRAGRAESLEVTLPYSKEKFGVPDNVYLIGTMNTADRSLAGLDIALRRRFKFEEMPPRPDALIGRIVAGVDLQSLLTTMNRRIEVLLGRDFLLGHAYFLGIADLADLADVFRRQVLPLLQEYFFEDWQRIAWVLNDQAKLDDAHRFLIKETASVGAVFGPGVDLPESNELWRINSAAFDRPESYAAILGAG